jgi:hypothetical protein
MRCRSSSAFYTCRRYSQFITTTQPHSQFRSCDVIFLIISHCQQSDTFRNKTGLTFIVFDISAEPYIRTSTAMAYPIHTPCTHVWRQGFVLLRQFWRSHTHTHTQTHTHTNTHTHTSFVSFRRLRCPFFYDASQQISHAPDHVPHFSPWTIWTALSVDVTRDIQSRNASIEGKREKASGRNAEKIRFTVTAPVYHLFHTSPGTQLALWLRRLTHTGSCSRNSTDDTHTQCLIQAAGRSYIPRLNTSLKTNLTNTCYRHWLAAFLKNLLLLPKRRYPQGAQNISHPYYWRTPSYPRLFSSLSGIYNPYEFEPPRIWGSEITCKDAPQSVGIPHMYFLLIPLLSTPHRKVPHTYARNKRTCGS